MLDNQVATETGDRMCGDWRIDPAALFRARSIGICRPELHVQDRTMPLARLATALHGDQSGQGIFAS